MELTPRQQSIVDCVRQHGFMSVESLSDHFSVTPQTIRRDINGLCSVNLLRRRHGGAEYIDVPPVNLSYDFRQIIRPSAKRSIGEWIARLIPQNASVSFGIGTTPEFVAHALRDHQGLTVVTNNLNVAMALSGNKTNRIILPGGTLRLPDRDLLGPEVIEMFNAYRVDFAVFGVAGIEPDGTLLDFDRSEVQARTALQDNCRTSILVADTTKCGRLAPAPGGFVGDADLIVLDAPPPEDYQPLFSRPGIAAKTRWASGEAS